MFQRKGLLVALSLLVGASAFAQDLPERPGQDDTFIPEHRKAQHENWKNGDDIFPAKPKTKWHVGVDGGMLRLGSDVTSEMGYAGGLSVRKSIGYLFWVRGRYTNGVAYGLNWAPHFSNAIDQNRAVNGTFNPTVDYSGNNADVLFHNYRMEWQNLEVEGAFNFNNLKFHKSWNYVSPYIFAGLGIGWYKTTTDQLNEFGQIYNYDGLVRTKTNDHELRDDQRDDLKNALDGDYESRAEIADQIDDTRVNDRNVLPTGSVGAGLEFKLNKCLALTIEHKMTFTGSDHMDGVRLTSEGFNSKSNDMVHYTNLGLNWRFGKDRYESEVWTNPLAYAYEQIDYLEKKTDFSDDDNDGVPNLWDQEPDSPEGAVVDPKGITMDSDGDGCPDHEDEEPFSSPQFPIVDCKTEWPEGISEEEVIGLIEEHGVDWFMPSIFFNLDKDNIKPSEVEKLEQVAWVMNRYPNLRVETIGYADIRASDEYNQDLSKRRVENAVQYIVDKYGISRARFNISYKGETDLLIDGARRESQHKMNRRVTFMPAKR